MGKMDKFKKKGTKIVSNLEEDLEEKKTMVLKGELPEDLNKIESIDISSIKPNPYNDYNQYDSDEGIITLAEDIERNGLLHNLVVSKRDNNQYVLISGERRYRALSYLIKENSDNLDYLNKYRYVPCRVIDGLTERQEIIMLDAANLQARGGAGNEVLSRKASVRYIENVKEEFGLSETQARKLLEEISSLSTTNISTNIAIQTTMNPVLTDYLDKEIISKNQARQFIQLTAEQQTTIADTISNAIEVFEKRGENGVKYIKKIADKFSVAAKEPTLRKIDEAVKGIAQQTEIELKKKKEPIETKNIDLALKEDKEEKNRSQRTIYINKCVKAIKAVDDLSTERTIKRISKFDKTSEEEDQKIINMLDELIEKSIKLRDTLKGMN